MDPQRTILELHRDPGTIIGLILVPDSPMECSSIYGFYRHGMIPEHQIEIVNGDVRDGAYSSTQSVGFSDWGDSSGVRGKKSSNRAFNP